MFFDVLLPSNVRASRRLGSSACFDTSRFHNLNFQQLHVNIPFHHYVESGPTVIQRFIPNVRSTLNQVIYTYYFAKQSAHPTTMLILTALAFLLSHLLLTNPLFRLYRNYRATQESGLRCIISPVTPYTLQWQLLATLLWPLLAVSRVGAFFIVVAPSFNVLCTSDARTIEHVLKKRREFVKPDNVNGDWIRHRKLTASCFNERASSIFWREALQHSPTMLTYWLSLPTCIATNMVKDTNTLAPCLISFVAFETQQVNEPTGIHTRFPCARRS
ncbi:hypothetical protein EJ02DRAFT_510644 [Clathrospora elynae]|uniref:Uncharacterized protein n=1 Tax=Clathrospora elynae TaxID=706981 RepID=A0A6A5T491_9PLEO|nr:hypothetical protein EJ02DRAFT_510644 [Clathrospora elynae]